MADTQRNEIEPLLTVEEVAEILRMHVQTVYVKARTGEIPSVKVGTQRRFRRSDIAALTTPTPVVGAAS